MGTLCVTVVWCRGVHGFDFGTKTDPYVVIKYNKQEKQTHVEEEAGDDADFYETLCFNYSSNQRLMEMEVRDKDIILYKKMGHATVNVTQAVRQGYWVADYAVMKNGSENGSVRLAMQFHASQDRSSCVYCGRTGTAA